MLKFEQYTANNYNKKDISIVSTLIQWYRKEQKKKVALLLIDLANIYVNSNYNKP